MWAEQGSGAQETREGLVSEDMSIQSPPNFSLGDGFINHSSWHLSLLKTKENLLAWLELSPEKEQHFLIRAPQRTNTLEL